MNKFLIALLIAFISSCAAVKEEPFSMKTSAFIPNEKYYRGGNYSVYVFANKSLIAKDNVKVDLHRITKSMVERALLSTGTVDLTKVKKEADYVVESILETANYGKKTADGQRYHIAPTTGSVRIYNKKGQLIKDIPFDNNAKEVSVQSASRDTIYREALYASIGYDVYDSLENFFSPKGLILSGKKAGDSYHLKARLNSGLVEVDDEIEVYAIEKLDNSLLKISEINHKKICDGEVIDSSDSSVIEVSVDNDCKVKKGYYISKKHDVSFIDDSLNFLGKGFNKMLRKNPIK